MISSAGNPYGYVSGNPIGGMDVEGLLTMNTHEQSVDNMPSTIENYPNDPNPSPTNDSGAHTSVDWRVFCDCSCKDDGYYLNNCDVFFDILVNIRPTGAPSCNKSRGWYEKAEQDHVNDIMQAINQFILPAIDAAEKRLKNIPFSTESACESSSESVIRLVISNTYQLVVQYSNRYDGKGKPHDCLGAQHVDGGAVNATLGGGATRSSDGRIRR